MIFRTEDYMRRQKLGYMKQMMMMMDKVWSKGSQTNTGNREENEQKRKEMRKEMRWNWLWVNAVWN